MGTKTRSLGALRVGRDPADAEAVDAVLQAGNVLLRVVAQSVIAVESVVTSPQLRILVLIAGDGPQTIGAVADELAVHPSNATRVCDRLVSLDLVKRVKSSEDRRVRSIDLTSAGSELVNSVLQQRRQAIARVLEKLDSPTTQEALSALRRFASAAGNVGITDGRFMLSLAD